MNAPRRVTLQVHNGQFISAIAGGGGALLANAEVGAGWETFTLEDLGDGKVALQTVGGHYVCAEQEGASNLVADRAKAAEWETFTLEDLGDGKIALKGVNGKYVTALHSGGHGLRCAATVVGDWERFRVHETYTNRRVRLKASNGRYVCADQGGGGYLIADRTSATEWETFTLIPLGYNTVALQTFDGRFVMASNNGGGALAATANAARSYETFTLVPQADGRIALRAGSGHYVCSEDGRRPMTADRWDLDEWERFTVEEATLTWDDLGGTLLGAPAVVSPGPGKIVVIARCKDQALWVLRCIDGVWGDWTKLPFTDVNSDPVAVSSTAGRIDVFYRGAGGVPTHFYGDGQFWYGVYPLGGGTASALGVAALGPGRLRLYHRGRENGLFEKCYENGAWGAWQKLPGYVCSAITAVSWQTDNRLDVFFRGLEDQLWHASHRTDGWHLGCASAGPLSSAPSVCTLGKDRLMVFFRGWDGALRMLEFDGREGPGWHAEVTLAQGISSTAAALPWEGGIELFARGVDGGLVRARLDVARWPVPSDAKAASDAIAEVPALSYAVPLGWMAQVPGYANKTLADLCIVRAHDAATADLSEHLSPDIDMPQLARLYPSVDFEWLAEQWVGGVRPEITTIHKYFLMGLLKPLESRISAGVYDLVAVWARAQALSVGGLLEAGVRWFDLRVCKVNGELRTHHGMAGPLISDVLDLVHAFVESTHGEVILLEFTHMSTLSGEDLAALFDLIVSKLGESTLVERGETDVKISTLRMGDLVGENPMRTRVIAILQTNYEDQRNAHAKKSLFWLGRDYDLYRDVNQERELLPHIMLRQREVPFDAPDGTLADIDWTYTPGMHDLALSLAHIFARELGSVGLRALPIYGLEIVSTVNNAGLGVWAETMSDDALRRINRFNMDFPERSVVAPLCVAISSGDLSAVRNLAARQVPVSVETLRDAILGMLGRLLDLLDLGRLLKEAAELVIGVMKAIPGLISGPAGAVQAAVSLGFSEATAAFAVAGAYGMNAMYAARLVTDVAEDAALLLRDTFERPAAEVYAAMRSGWGLSEDGAREVMGAVGYTADAIESAVSQAMGEIADFFADLF